MLFVYSFALKNVNGRNTKRKRK